MPPPVFIQSMLVGLSIAAPVGPIGLLVIQRTLQHGAAVGLATGLGAAVADAAYGAVAAFGVTVLLHALHAARLPLALCGGAVLLWLAWRTWVAAGAPAASAAPAGTAAPGLVAAFAGTCVLTLANPATVLSFVSVFGVLAAASRTAVAPAWMVAGVLLGSALWWCALCALVRALRSRFDARARRLVSRASALMLAGLALWQAARAIAMLA
jgi:threonine/homoserine/homoserine lactone efflux protein